MLRPCRVTLQPLSPGELRRSTVNVNTEKKVQSVKPMVSSNNTDDLRNILNRSKFDKLRVLSLEGALPKVVSPVRTLSDSVESTEQLTSLSNLPTQQIKAASIEEMPISDGDEEELLRSEVGDDYKSEIDDGVMSIAPGHNEFMEDQNLIELNANKDNDSTSKKSSMTSGKKNSVAGSKRKPDSPNEKIEKWNEHNEKLKVKGEPFQHNSNKDRHDRESKNGRQNRHQSRFDRRTSKSKFKKQNQFQQQRRDTRGPGFVPPKPSGHNPQVMGPPSLNMMVRPFGHQHNSQLIGQHRFNRPSMSIQPIMRPTQPRVSCPPLRHHQPPPLNIHLPPDILNRVEDTLAIDEKFNQDRNGPKKISSKVCKEVWRDGCCKRGQLCPDIHRWKQRQNSNDSSPTDMDFQPDYEHQNARPYAVTNSVAPGDINGLIHRLSVIICEEIHDFSLCSPIIKQVERQFNLLIPDQQSKFKRRLEDLMLKLSKFPTEENAEVACRILDTKKSISNEKFEDFLYAADILARVNDMRRAFKIISEEIIKSSDLFSNKNQHHLCMLFEHCITESGEILKYWNHFKKIVLKSNNTMDRLFSGVPFERLEEVVSVKDLNHCYTDLLNGTLILSSQSRTIFLKLFSPIATIYQLAEVLKKWTDLHVVPLITLEKLLNSVNDIMQDALAIIPILKRLPSELSIKAPESWNAFLLKCCTAGSNYFQISEQIYGLMQYSSIVPNVKTALQMLSIICQNKHYELFTTRCKELRDCNVFPEEFKTPDWFASIVGDALDEYEGQDVNVVHNMILFLLSSNQLPQESQVDIVLDMLMSKRKYSDILDVVEKCFSSNLLLSQQQLRKVVFTLEGWMNNVNASTYVYQKMRENYRRPEHLCNCGTGNVGNSHHINRRTSNPIEMEAESFKEVHNNIDRSTVLMISAKLNVCDGDQNMLKNLYVQAVKQGAANDNNILTSLFFVLTGRVHPEKDFKIFVTLLENHFIPMSDESFSFDDDIKTALARLALRVIKYLQDMNKCEEAYVILETIHSHEISYSTCGDPFGTLMQTEKRLTNCQIAVLCFSVCVGCQNFEGAYLIFYHCSSAIKMELESEEMCTSNEDISQLNIVAEDIIKGLILANKPKKAWQIFSTLFNAMNVTTKETLSNDLCVSFCKSGEHSYAKNALLFIDSNRLNIHNLTESAYLTLLSGTLRERYSEATPFVMHISSTELSNIELQLLMEDHARELCLQVLCNEDSSSFRNNTFCIEFNVDEYSYTLRDHVFTVLYNNIKPPWNVVSSSEENVQVSSSSIKHWFDSKEGSKSKSRRTVDVSDSYVQPGIENMQILYCPTPAAVYTDSESNGSSENIVEEHSQEHVSNGINVLEHISNARQIPKFLNTKPVKFLPDTDDEKIATRQIIKILSAQLTSWLNRGKVQSHEFSEICKQIYTEFRKRLTDRGPVVYNNSICLEAMDYVDSKFLISS